MPLSAEAALGGLSSFCNEPGGWQRGGELAEPQPLQRDLPAGVCLSGSRALLSQVQHWLQGAAGAAGAASSGWHREHLSALAPGPPSAPAAPAVPGEGSSELWLTGSRARAAPALPGAAIRALPGSLFCYSSTSFSEPLPAYSLPMSKR